MIGSLLKKLGLGDGSLNSGEDSRRKYIRHPAAQAEVVVADRVYSLRDWSMGGISFDTTLDARLTEGDIVQFMLRFRLPHDTISIPQQGRVVRTARRGVAAEFAPLSLDVRRKFEKVLDSLHTQSFVESQVA